MMNNLFNFRTFRAVGACAATAYALCKTENNYFIPTYGIHCDTSHKKISKVYESCEVVGEGLRGEIWKRRHSNVQVLELDNEYVQLIVSKLRDKHTTPRLYRHYAKRLFGIVVEHALSTLPTADHIIETPCGYKYNGTVLEFDEKKLLGVCISRDSDIARRAFRKIVPDLATARLYVDRPDISIDERQTQQNNKIKKPAKRVSEAQIPKSNLHEYERIFVFDPVIGKGETVQVALKWLKNHGVPEDKITVVALTVGPNAANNMMGFPDVTLVTATIEADLDPETSYLVPGIGHFEERYLAGGPETDEDE